MTAKDQQDQSIISAVVQTEGDYSNDPSDPGGRTFEGISEHSFPEAWAHGQPSDAQVRAIYLAKFVEGPGFDQVQDEGLRHQLVDFGVNSGPSVAIQKVQGVLGLFKDGILGPHTAQAINQTDSRTLGNALAVARLRMISDIIARRPAQAHDAPGWIKRAAEFIK